MYIKHDFSNTQIDENLKALVETEYSNISCYANLIGSANYAFPSVLKALDTPFNMNPAEGSIGNRYFPLCSSIDQLELFGDFLIKKLFNLNNDYFSNLEPHSGTQANQIVYNAVLNAGDTVIAMDSKSGGHVSHHFFLKKYYNLIEYGVTKNEIIDYDNIEFLCKKYHPKLLIAGCSSYPRQVDYKTIGNICKKYNVKLLADISHTVIYIINNNHISPFDYADFVTFTTHKTTRGIRGGIIIYKKDYRSSIEKSVFPYMQGAPKFNEVLAKVFMLNELCNIDISMYVNKIQSITNTFVRTFKNNDFHLYTNGSDMHLITIDVSKNQLTGKECEELLKDQYILVNRNSLPNDVKGASITSGIRMGTLSLATLDMKKEDYKLILDIIVQTIKYKNIINNDVVKKIMSKYKIIN